ncbi:MAG: hypothetical protein ACNA8H_04400 [Anaerolineales bacterium]
MSKYTPLRDYLAAVPDEVLEFSLSFEKIEELLNSRLPPTAERDREWWSNEVNGRDPQPAAWRQAGWLVKFVELPERWVKFWRDGKNSDKLS